MSTFNLIVWVLFIASLIFLGYFFIKRIMQNKKAQREAAQSLAQKKEKYSYLREGALDDCPREDLSSAVLFHCMRKEDDDFEHYFDNMNNSERVIYGIYQVSSSLSGSNPSLHSFFLSPACKQFVPIVSNIFEEVGAHEIADLMKAARRFAEIIENDEEDDENDPDMGIYARYNFSDFTNEFVTLVSTTNLNEKITKFILKHKSDFYDTDIPEDVENGDDEDERISD